MARRWNGDLYRNAVRSRGRLQDSWGGFDRPPDHCDKSSERSFFCHVQSGWQKFDYIREQRQSQNLDHLRDMERTASARLDVSRGDGAIWSETLWRTGFVLGK